MSLALCARALAQSNYPDKPIRILVGFSAGVAPDVTSRLFGDKFNETWAKGVVVENVTGAGGNLRGRSAAKAAPDGYTLVMGGNASLVINPNLMDKLGYDPVKDFAYITQVFIVPNLVVVHAGRAGQDHPGAGCARQGQAGLFRRRPCRRRHLAASRRRAVHGDDRRQDSAGAVSRHHADPAGPAGRAASTCSSATSPTCLPLVREGKLRAFAVTSRKRSPQIPELPTMEELGFPGFEATAWFGLMAPAGTPQPMVDKLHAETVKVMAHARRAQQARRPRTSAGRQHAGGVRRFDRKEMPSWGKVIKDAGIKAHAIQVEAKEAGMIAIRVGLAVLAALLIGCARGRAGRYPDKPVRFIVGFTPGSATDITARLFAQKFAEAWGVPVTVENVPGAGGSVGGDRVAKAAPDGATFYWGANGALTINPTLQANASYDVQRDLAPVARLLVMASILAVNTDVPAKSVAELFALAKAQPGTLSYASPGVGTPQHIAGEAAQEAWPASTSSTCRTAARSSPT